MLSIYATIITINWRRPRAEWVGHDTNVPGLDGNPRPLGAGLHVRRHQDLTDIAALMIKDIPALHTIVGEEKVRGIGF